MTIQLDRTLFFPKKNDFLLKSKKECLNLIQEEKRNDLIRDRVSSPAGITIISHFKRHFLN